MKILWHFSLACQGCQALTPPPKKKPFPLFSKFIRILCFVPEDCWHFTHAQFRCNFRLTIQDQLVLVSPLKWCLRGERVVADLEQKAEVSTQQPESRRLRVLTGLATEITIGLCHRRARDPPLQKTALGLRWQTERYFLQFNNVFSQNEQVVRWETQCYCIKHPLFNYPTNMRT